MPNKADKCTAVHIPSILLPKKGTDLEKWAVVACDQYTSQEEYWEKADRFVGDSDSTLRLILPEVYLEKQDKEDRISRINGTMQKYLDEKVLVETKPGFIYVDRSTSHVQSRKGLVLAVDLEEYDYSKGSRTLIRATEGTVVDRLPPRVKIREKAPIELPHIMLLIDDPGRTVIEPLDAKKESLEKLYDFQLMMDGGRIRGYKVDEGKLTDEILEALSALARPEAFTAKYGVGPEKGILLFAVGDGNHSLASAKVFWENLKATLPEEERQCHPARFALVEVVNVHDEGLVFEPIHRVLFNVDAVGLLNSLVDFFKAFGSRASYTLLYTEEAMKKETALLNKNGDAHVIAFTTSEAFGVITVENPPYNLEVGTLQSFLDDYANKHGDCKIDYIHGDEVVRSLGSKKGNMGFYLPAMNKHDLFKTVILDGALPRKTFSMGEADEKRFYLECRCITK